MDLIPDKSDLEFLSPDDSDLFSHNYNYINSIKLFPRIEYHVNLYKPESNEFNSLYFVLFCYDLNCFVMILNEHLQSLILIVYRVPSDTECIIVKGFFDQRTALEWFEGGLKVCRIIEFCHNNLTTPYATM